MDIHAINRIIDNPRYIEDVTICDAKTEITILMPMIYKSMDCFVCLDHCDTYSIYINRLDTDGTAPCCQEYLIEAFGRKEHIPTGLIPQFKTVMSKKADYLSGLGFNYLAWCNHNYTINDLALFDVLDGFSPS